MHACQSAVLLAAIVACTSCQETPRAKPATVTHVEPAPSAAPPTAPTAKAVQPLRFSVGASSPELGCFAKSDKLNSFACVVGRSEEEPDGKKTGIVTAIRFTNRDTHAPLPLAEGVLDEPSRQSLDAAMVAGEYVALEAPAWSSTSPSAEPNPFRIVVEPYRFQVEHGGKSIHERQDRGIRRLPRKCAARAWMLGEAIVIELSCRTLDEGWEVLELEVWQCDATHCV